MKAKTSLFQTTVYGVTSRIPKGKVATYGQIAKLAGKPQAARAVGMFMSKNTDGKAVPCHRVVASSGALAGYGMGGVGIKKKMLLTEGVHFKGVKVDLATSKWVPR